MATQAYRFHCTDGHVAIIDTAGVIVPDRSQIQRYAEQAARYAMEQVGRMLDWSEWIVDVHDDRGRRVLMLAFKDVHNVRLAA
jgi:hypothetical protein